jgi:ketosteroid isomerase-like protein
MNSIDNLRFSKEWEDGWNSHNIEAIISHYREDILFHSKKAIPIMGTGEIRGKSNLKIYWSQALQKQPNLKFKVINVFEGVDMMVITYRNNNNALAAEILYFDREGLVYQAGACHQIT